MGLRILVCFAKILAVIITLANASACLPISLESTILRRRCLVEQKGFITIERI